jgi:hypothetical protein
MSSRDQYVPGAAFGAQVRKGPQEWTLVLVRDLRHSPERVWAALTDPVHLRQWAPFDSDRNLGAVGTAKLTAVGAPTPQVSETRVKRADPLKALQFDWGGQDIRWELEPLGGAAPGSRSGTPSTVVTSPGALRAGTSASTCWIGSSAVNPSDASSAPTPCSSRAGSD